jgi:predicted thioredoxin/glutaredoxin
MNNKSEEIKKLLIGGDLRSIGDSSKIIKLINNQNDFDLLFGFINSDDRLIVMRAADVIEKITRNKKKYLDKHKNNIIRLLEKATNKELKWHLAQIVSRLNLTSKDSYKVFSILKKWILDKNESRIVRVDALQSISEISKIDPTIKQELNQIICQIKTENIPSLNARIKKINL